MSVEIPLNPPRRILIMTGVVLQANGRRFMSKLDLKQDPEATKKIAQAMTGIAAGSALIGVGLSHLDAP